jgi:hypothetical protein
MEQNKDDVTPRSRKGGTFGKRLWKGPECNTGIRDRGLKERLRDSKQMKDATTNGIKGWSKESEHLRELEEYAKKTYMRILMRRSWNMHLELPVGY